MKYPPLFSHSNSKNLLYLTLIILFSFASLSLILDFIPALLLTLGLLVFIALSLYAIQDPAIILILAIMSSYLGIWGALLPQEKLPITIFQIFLIYSIITFSLNRIQRSNFQFPFHDLYILIIFFIGFLIFSSFYSEARGEAIFLTFTLIILFLFSIVVSNTLIKIKHFIILFIMIIIISMFFSLFSIYSFIVNPDNLILNYLSGDLKVFGRQSGTIGDPNQFGILLIFPLLFISYELFIRTNKLQEINLKKIFYFIPFILLIGALLVTYSRSSWLAFIIAIIFLFLITGKIKRLIVLSFSVFIGLIMIGFGNLFFATVINRILSITDLSLNISNTTRVILAKAGIDMFFDSYFWGNGYRSFRVLAPHYYDTTKTMGIIDNHNIIIELLADLGVLGLILFLIIYISYIREGYKIFKIADDKLKPYIVTFITYLVALFIFYQFYGGGLHDNLMWFCFGAIFAFKNGIVAKI